MFEEEAGKVSVETLIPRDEFVAEGEAGHEAALLQPEDGREAAREEDALDGGESDDALGEGGVVGVNPAQCPLGLLLDGRNGLDSVKKLLLLVTVSKCKMPKWI